MQDVVNKIASDKCSRWFNSVMADLLTRKQKNQLSSQDLLPSSFGGTKQSYSLQNLVNYAEFAKFDSSKNYGLSVDETTKLNDKGLAVTIAQSSYQLVVLGPNIFRRSEDTWFNKVNIDTSGHLVHEMFHVAGFSDNIFNWYKWNNQSLNSAIHENCGLPNTNF